ncbi:MAG: fumarylacetoacetate hydrolase family protein [Actinomycetota bacterium]|nr:fumarylacetoacetate hydrolase family protein [Actinomycetota bacterium]
MRLARIRTNDDSALFAAAVGDNGWVPVESLGVSARNTAELITAFQSIDSSSVENSSEALDEVLYLNPIVPPANLMAIGFNYLDHINEAKVSEPKNPIVFAKFTNSLNDPYGRIVIDPRLTDKGDYEVELAVVIGASTKGISEADALSCVFGYTIANDVSARDWQRADGQFDRSKSFDTFCPVGPWITTADEVPDPQGLPLRSWVNGELRQDSSTKEMFFSVAYLIHYLARGMTLGPGDVILTGTPHGVGSVMDPPQYLKPGDVVTCEVEGLGRIEHEVVAP